MPRLLSFLLILLTAQVASTASIGTWVSPYPWDIDHKFDTDFDRRINHQLAYRNRLFNIYLSDEQFLQEAPRLARSVWSRLASLCSDGVRAPRLRDPSTGLEISNSSVRQVCDVIAELHRSLQKRDTGLAGFRISSDTFLHLKLGVTGNELSIPGDLLVPQILQTGSYPTSDDHPSVEFAARAVLTLLMHSHPEVQKVKQTLWMSNGCYGDLKPKRCGPDFVRNLVGLLSPPVARWISGSDSVGWWASAARYIQLVERGYEQREGLPHRLTAPGDILLGNDARNGFYKVRAHEIRSRAFWGAEQSQYRGTSCGSTTAEPWLSEAAKASPCTTIPLSSLLSAETLGFIQEKLLKNFGAGSLHTRANADKAVILSSKAVATAATGAFIWFGWRMASLVAPAKVNQVAGLVGGTASSGAVNFAGVAKKAYGAVAVLELLGLAWPNLDKWIGAPASRALYWLSGGELFAASWAWVDEAMDAQGRDLSHRSRVSMAESLEALAKSQSSVQSRTLTEEEYARLSGSRGKTGSFWEMWSGSAAAAEKRECGVARGAPAYLIQLPRSLCELCDQARALSPESCLKEVLNIQMRDRTGASLIFGRLLDRDQKISQAERHLQSLERLTLEWTGLAQKLNGKKSPDGVSVVPAQPGSAGEESPVLWIDN